MSHLVNDLRCLSGDISISSGVQASVRRTCALWGTFPSASGSLVFNVVCTMAAETATPQTVPIDRIRYTVEEETAWSIEQSA